MMNPGALDEVFVGKVDLVLRDVGGVVMPHHPARPEFVNAREFFKSYNGAWRAKHPNAKMRKYGKIHDVMKRGGYANTIADFDALAKHGDIIEDEYKTAIGVAEKLGSQTRTHNNLPVCRHQTTRPRLCT
jgi:hypothetical protein